MATCKEIVRLDGVTYKMVKGSCVKCVAYNDAALCEKLYGVYGCMDGNDPKVMWKVKKDGKKVLEAKINLLENQLVNLGVSTNKRLQDLENKATKVYATWETKTNDSIR